MKTTRLALLGVLCAAIRKIPISNKKVDQTALPPIASLEQ
jgi:hypothetical protein